jgi:2-keto-3-deoxy-L-rhamnonate aldolase RhmA
MSGMNVIDTRLPELLRGTRPLLGMFVGIPAPSLVEMCGHAGVDFVIVDNEHGPAGIESTEHMLRAARASGVIPVVRTLEADILRVLDIGASAIQVPQVNSAEQAKRIVAAAKYPPIGMRGAAFSTRAAGYGFFGGDRHIADSNAGTAVIIMTETRAAIEHLDEILTVPGIDAIFFGPNDLSFSFGHPGQMGHPEVIDAIEHGIARALAHGVAPGVLALNADDFHRWRQKGARYLPMVMSGMIGNALRTTVAATRATG